MYRRCATRGDAARHPPRTVDGMTVGGTNARLRPRNRSAMIVMLLSWNLMNCYGSLDYTFGKRMVMMFVLVFVFVFFCFNEVRLHSKGNMPPNENNNSCVN